MSFYHDCNALYTLFFCVCFPCVLTIICLAVVACRQFTSSTRPCPSRQTIVRHRCKAYFIFSNSFDTFWNKWPTNWVAFLFGRDLICVLWYRQTRSRWAQDNSNWMQGRLSPAVAIFFPIPPAGLNYHTVTSSGHLVRHHHRLATCEIIITHVPMGVSLLPFPKKKEEMLPILNGGVQRAMEEGTHEKWPSRMWARPLMRSNFWMVHLKADEGFLKNKINELFT